MKKLKPLIFATFLFLATCKADDKTEILPPDPPPSETTIASINIDLPISNSVTDSLEINTISWEGHPLNKSFTCNLKKNCYNLVYLLKNGELYGFVRIDPTKNQTITITTDLVAKSIISLISEFLDPGYGSINNSFDKAESLLHFQDMVNILSSKWNANGISDLENDTTFSYTIKGLVSDLLASKKKEDPIKQKRIFSIKNKSTDNVIFSYITFPTIKESGLEITNLNYDGNKVKFTFENKKRRQADIFIYKNNTLVNESINLGGKVQSGIISGLISESLFPSKKDLELDFSNMTFNDSYQITVLGPGWSMPWLTDYRYTCITCPFIRTIIVNQGIPIVTCIIDGNTNNATGLLGLGKDLYSWIQNGVDWVTIQNSLKKHEPNTPEFWYETYQAIASTITNFLSQKAIVEVLGENVYNYHGAALNSWADKVVKNANKFAQLLSIIGMAVEQVFVINDYMNTAYRTDYYCIKTNGQGDLQGGWQGLEVSGGNSQEIYIFNHSDQNNYNFHRWSYGYGSGFCEMNGDGTYNPSNRTGIWYDRNFINYQPMPGWCWTHGICNFTLNQGLNHLEGNLISQPGDPCWENATVTLEKE